MWRWRWWRWQLVVRFTTVKMKPTKAMAKENHPTDTTARRHPSPKNCVLHMILLFLNSIFKYIILLSTSFDCFWIVIPKHQLVWYDMMSPGSKSESTDVGDCRLLSQAPFHDRPNRLTWSSVMMRNRKSTSAKQGLRMSGIYMRRIVASSLKFPRLPGVPSPPMCIRSVRRAYRWTFGNWDARVFGLSS